MRVLVCGRLYVSAIVYSILYVYVLVCIYRYVEIMYVDAKRAMGVLMKD